MPTTMSVCAADRRQTSPPFLLRSSRLSRDALSGLQQCELAEDKIAVFFRERIKSLHRVTRVKFAGYPVGRLDFSFLLIERMNRIFQSGLIIKYFDDDCIQIFI